MIRPVDPNEKADLDAFLSMHSATSMFLRSNLAEHGLTGRNHPHATRYWRWPEHGAIEAILGLTRSGMVLCQCAGPHSGLAAFVPALCGQTLTGFSGEADQTAVLIKALGLAEADFRVNHVEPLFRLDLADLASGADRIRSAKPGDLPILEGWFEAYMRDTGLGTGDRRAGIAEAAERAAAAILPASPLRLLPEDGRPVAMASLNARAGTSVQVGGVYVPSQFRNRGYGRRIVRALLSQARAAGATEAVLFSNNDAASAVYRALGFQQVGKYRIAFLQAEHIVEAQR